MINFLQLKHIFSWVAYNFGLLRMFSSKNNSIIVAYHHVLPENDKRIQFLQPGMYVSEKSFESHMKYLVAHYDVVPLNDIIHAGKTRKACSVTFDDGWSDNYEYAYPILKKYKIPATFFLATNFIGTNKWPWPDRMSYYIHNSASEEIDSIVSQLQDNFEAGKCLSKLQALPRNKSLAAEYLIDTLKQLNNDDLKSAIDIIEKNVSCNHSELSALLPFLTWEQINEMSNNNMSFGAHTHNHIILDRVKQDQIKDEIATSQAILADKLKKKIDTFSYPNGWYNQHAVDTLGALGFTIAVTTRKGTVKESESNLALRRILIHDDIADTLPMFACRLEKRLFLF